MKFIMDILLISNVLYLLNKFKYLEMLYLILTTE